MSIKIVRLHEIVRLCDDPSMPASLREDLRRAAATTITYDKDQGLLRLKSRMVALSRAPPEEVAPPANRARTEGLLTESGSTAVAQLNTTLSLSSVLCERDVFKLRPRLRARATAVATAAAALLAVAGALASVWTLSPRSRPLTISMSFPSEHLPYSAGGLGPRVGPAGFFTHAVEPVVASIAFPPPINQMAQGKAVPKRSKQLSALAYGSRTPYKPCGKLIKIPGCIPSKSSVEAPPQLSFSLRAPEPREDRLAEKPAANPPKPQPTAPPQTPLERCGKLIRKNCTIESAFDF